MKYQEIAPIKVNTEPDVFNEFINHEAFSSKSNRGPMLDPKISKFYEKPNPRRQIYSEEKSRNLHCDQGLRYSVAKTKTLDNLQLMTFYNKNDGKRKSITTTEQS